MQICLFSIAEIRRRKIHVECEILPPYGRRNDNYCHLDVQSAEESSIPLYQQPLTPKTSIKKNPGLKSAGIFHFTERLYFNVKVAFERISVEEDPTYTVNLPGSDTHS